MVFLILPNSKFKFKQQRKQQKQKRKNDEKQNSLKIRTIQCSTFKRIVLFNFVFGIFALLFFFPYFAHSACFMRIYTITVYSVIKMFNAVELNVSNISVSIQWNLYTNERKKLCHFIHLSILFFHFFDFCLNILLFSNCSHCYYRFLYKFAFSCKIRIFFFCFCFWTLKTQMILVYSESKMGIQIKCSIWTPEVAENENLN